MADIFFPLIVFSVFGQNGYSVNFKAEAACLSPNLLSVDDFAVFVELDEGGTARLEDGMEVRIVHGTLLEVYEADGGRRAALDLTVLQEDEDEGGEAEPDEQDDEAAVFCAPAFGVTFLGTSHGERPVCM